MKNTETASKPHYLFIETAKKYRLSTPDQIKTRIIWDHVCMMHSQMFGDSEQNKELRDMYKAEFTICEVEEKRIIEMIKAEQEAL